MTKIAPATFIDQSLRADPDFGPGCLIKEQGMAVKRVVVYPYPKDIDAFESVYNNEHVSDGNRKPERKDKDCRDKGSQLAACRACLLSRGRGPFPHSRSPGG